MSAHPIRRRRATSASPFTNGLPATSPDRDIEQPTVPSPLPIHDFANGNATLRHAIAQQAAQLIFEGQRDYHAAKIKAAKAIGIDSADHHVLPCNTEIEAALREHLTLFAGETQLQALDSLRIAACQSMQWLAHFEPWLTGGVLNGTANEYSVVELELIGVEAKSFELFLLGEDVEFDIREHRAQHSHRRERHAGKKSFKPIGAAAGYSYEIFFDDAPVEITLYDSHAERQAKHPRTSIRHHRAQLAEVIRRFDAGKSEIESLVSAADLRKK